MAGRRFVDAAGLRWEVRVRSRSEWEFEPVEGNPGPARFVQPPRYEADPFEMSIEELHRLLASAPPPRPRPKNSPFLD